MYKKIKKIIIIHLENPLYLLMLLFIFISTYLLLRLFLLPEVAIYKAKNPNNIQSSCLYLISEHRSKQGRKKVIEIDGNKYHTDSMKLNEYLFFRKYEKQFPFYHKNKYFQGNSIFWDKIVTKKNICYEIKYIKIFDFIYIYDFEMPNEFRSYNFQPIQLKKIY